MFDVLEKYDLISLENAERKLPVVIQNFFPYVLEFFRDNTDLPLIYLVKDETLLNYSGIQKLYLLII